MTIQFMLSTYQNTEDSIQFPPIDCLVDVGIDRHQQALTSPEHVRAGHAAVTVLRS